MAFDKNVSHYQIAGVQVDDILVELFEKWGPSLIEQGYTSAEVMQMGFYMGNIGKYFLRAASKDQFKDLDKMQDYISQVLKRRK